MALHELADSRKTISKVLEQISLSLGSLRIRITSRRRRLTCYLIMLIPLLQLKERHKTGIQIIYIRLHPKPKRSEDRQSIFNALESTFPAYLLLRLNTKSYQSLPGVPIIMIPFFAASLALFDRLGRRAAALHFLPPCAKALLNVGLGTK
ncbi:uncharacterized protein N7446_000274 [Penicillium canescens]|uniref:Uncharacterized protein n=1 Tax=Penicillium canescens TaxID=5083 RepID=A0AAD6I4Q7_PENCN|nr:uncharacterized protein N7446_000274 [Penicillium canescens]KAJ6030664.1 hypothetical protein N7460_010930 [Penicillium canescens]KAJ6059620.1 hypothetical protein N7444_003259 [Penicillium canescens]KAJ6077338.1 hypothetical protein N7446_000274 [Penicillium canescens]